MAKLVFILAVALCLASVILCLDLSAPALDVNIVDEINNNAQSTWKARINEKFANLTIAQAKKFFTLTPSKPLRKISFGEGEKASPQLIKALPDSYDTDKLYPQCLIEINDQGQCGSSWAFPVVYSTGNRYCIAEAKKGRTVEYHLSTQYLLSCDKVDFCCSGGNLATAYDFIEENGIPTEKCFHYQSGQGACPNCPSKCQDGSPLNLVNPLKPNTTRTFSNVESAMLDIMTYGYAATGIKVYQDLTTYAGGVYQHLTGAYMGDHGVRVNGWGVDSVSKVPYWIIANSWGKSWGEKGYVRVRRGTDECSIEKYMTAASPADV